MIKIEINGVEIEAEPGSMIIQVADRLSIPIPRFCYHPKLSIAANCRMCLVHVEKAPKALPACATPITEGMKVWTASKTAVDAQKAVMEFLLINHPLDCPICDQGGECELQDVSLEYGNDSSRFSEPKRVVEDHNLGSLVQTDLTRCIQCSRCTRFGAEISGERELGMTGRGEDMKISTFVEQHVNSEVSGNVIDLCPVGALTSKPFRFKARAWELDEYPAVSPHDCVGSNLHLHVLNNTVMRVVPKDNEDINEIWLSDRDRFSYQALTHAERLRKPMLYKHDKWHLVSWVEALKYSVAGIKLAVDAYGADQLGVLTSPNSTVEELILLQQLTRGFGSANIDHRLRQIDFSDQDSAPLYSNLGVTIKELASQDAVLLIGSDLHKEQPIVGLKVRKISLKNGKVCVVNPAKFKFNFSLAGELVVSRADILNGLAEIAKELLVLTQNPNFSGAKELVSDITPSPNAKIIAQELLTAGSKRLVILGQLALMHPQAALIRNLANLIANILNAKYGEFTDGANAAGAWLTGCVPHRLPGGAKSATIGKNARQMLTEPMRCYILYAIEPEFDSIWGEQALQTLKKADFVVVISAYQSDTLLDIADVILPLSLFAEITGTTINIDGKWQTTSSVIPTFGDSRPGWKILRVLGNLAQLPDFEYFTEQQVLDAARNQIGNPVEPNLASWQCPSHLPKPDNNSNLIRIAPLGLYSVDGIVRRSNALQATLDAHSNPSLQINSKTAEILKLRHGDMAEVKSEHGSAKLPVLIAESVADFSALIYQSNIKTNILGAPYSEIEVHIC